jgi:hypothetical protein
LTEIPEFVGICEAPLFPVAILEAFIYVDF